MKTVKEIHDFFMNPPAGKKLTLDDFMKTVPDYIVEHIPTGGEKCNWSMAQEYYRICEKMCDDLLLLKHTFSTQICIANGYMGISTGIADEEEEINQDLEYGAYDFKYRGFVYTRDCFCNSVLPIDAIKQNGDGDIGTAYYIGENRFVTAAHCIKDVTSFNLLLPDGRPIVLKEVWFANGQDVDAYDLAVIVADGVTGITAFRMAEPNVLDDVLVMGYPPIAGFNAILTAETASVGAILKSSTGQVVGQDTPYGLQLDAFLINARVKGGNSGGPVINNMGKVIGTVVKLPFDIASDSNNPRYDLMGYGSCMPSKYVTALMGNPTVKVLVQEGGKYHF